MRRSSIRVVGRWGLLLAGALLLLIIAFGMYKAFILVRDRNALRRNGQLTVARIATVWKEKCGMSYGYSATFTYEVNGSTLAGTCECESRAWVEPGEKYLAAYDPLDPERVLLLADSLVP